MINIKKDKFYKIKFYKIDIIKILLLTIYYFKKWVKELHKLDKKEAFLMQWKKVKLEIKEVCQMRMILSKSNRQMKNNKLKLKITKMFKINK